MTSKKTISDQIYSTVVEKIIEKKDKFLKIAVEEENPCYVYDRANLLHNVKNFQEIFKKHLSKIHFFYALKINHYQGLLEDVQKSDFGFDVASGHELEKAISLGSKKIVFYSPGKSEKELLLAIKHHDKVIINIDSYQELDTLGKLTNKYRKNIRAGIRIHFKSSGYWAKFGIPLAQLKKILIAANKYQYLDLCGIHFHSSRNNNGDFYSESIKDLGLYLKNNLTNFQLKSIKFIDIGGGFDTNQTEGYFPVKALPITKKKTTYDQLKRSFEATHVVRESDTLEEYAQKIAAAIKKYFDPIIQADYFVEPGRIICDSAMHILLRVVDQKDTKTYVANGGINMLGWQRFMYEYFPIINLSQPSKKRQLTQIYGRLCSTRDIWGYSYYGKSLAIGDVILVPNQGSLTYSLAQEWIMPFPIVRTV